MQKVWGAIPQPPDSVKAHADTPPPLPCASRPHLQSLPAQQGACCPRFALCLLWQPGQTGGVAAPEGTCLMGLDGVHVCVKR
jgi:hypothetical protein